VARLSTAPQTRNKRRLSACHRLSGAPGGQLGFEAGWQAVQGGTADLLDWLLAPEQLAARVLPFADKVLSDGASIDDPGNLYVTDVEHSGVARCSHPIGQSQRGVRAL